MACATAKQLSEYADIQSDYYVIYAGERYRRYLLPFIPDREIPMENLLIGEQSQYLKKRLN